MFGNLRARWNVSRQRRFERRVAKYLRTNFAEVVGSDDGTLDQPDSVAKLHAKYFGKAS